MSVTTQSHAQLVKRKNISKPKRFCPNPSCTCTICSYFSYAAQNKRTHQIHVYELLSLTYKVLTTNQHQYLHNLISLQPCHNTRSLSMVTLVRPPTRSSLKITNRSFQYATPCLWNELPTDLCEPRQTQSRSLSPITNGSSSSSFSPSSRSPLSPSLTRSVFHSELKTWFFGKSLPP